MTTLTRPTKCTCAAGYIPASNLSFEEYTVIRCDWCKGRDAEHEKAIAEVIELRQIIGEIKDSIEHTGVYGTVVPVATEIEKLRTDVAFYRDEANTAKAEVKRLGAEVVVLQDVITKINNVGVALRRHAEAAEAEVGRLEEACSIWEAGSEAKNAT